MVVLELALPDGSGLDLARTLAGRAVIFLKREASVETKLEALEVADDYVTKPYGSVELVARVHAILRRRARTDQEPLRFTDVVLDPRTREVARAGRELALTPTEFELLRYFLLNPRRVLSRRELLGAVWGAEQPARSNAVETYVGYLRAKLDPLGPPLLHTRRLVGYVLSE